MSGLHPNGVRVHLTRLERGGLVARARERGSRGRPRDLWAVAPAPPQSRPTAYGELARWLVRVLVASRTDGATLERRGREIGREIAPESSASPSATMLAALGSMGFAPQASLREDGALGYELCNCPYRDAVRAGGDAVCALHRGITLGLLDGVSPGTRLTDFVPKDPDRGGCRVEVRGPLAADAAAGTPGAP